LVVLANVIAANGLKTPGNKTADKFAGGAIDANSPQ
jgi:hypothetical protein